MQKTIETSININATPQKVWDILCNTKEYPNWNPFVRSVEGSFARGQTIKVMLRPLGGNSFTFMPEVLNVSFPEIRWRGKFLLGGLFDGEHYFRVDPVGANSTRFIHGEQFSGVLIGLMGGVLEKNKRGFELMNQVLKKQAEQ
jgi:hypothetical protein